MNTIRILAVLGLSALAAMPVYGQNTDTASERARLANERIRLEAQRREEEERRRLEQEAAEAEAAETSATAGRARATTSGKSGASRRQDPLPASPGAPTESSPSRAGNPTVSLVLRQLRELGELKDAGYVTEEEFERIKARILASEF